MARPAGEKTRCGGLWTEARFNSFIKSALRSATVRWAPISECKKQARVGRGEYLCASCRETVPPTVVDPEKRKRVNNIFVDHVKPVIDPALGFMSWDDYINNMFCEIDNLELICKKCHDSKTAEERGVAVERRRKEKELGQ